MTQDNRSIEELAEAEIVPEKETGNTWLVRFGPNDYDHVNKTPKNRLLLEDDVLDRDSFTFGGVTVGVDFEDDEYRLTDGDRSVDVPSEKEEHVLWSVYDEDGQRLQGLLDELYEEQVRVGLMDWFMPRFRSAREENRLRKVEDGWLVDEEVLVQWNGENVCATDVETVNGSATPIDEQSARDLDFGEPVDRATVEAPSGKEVELEQMELEFLATVEFLLNEETIMDDNLESSNDDAIEELVHNARVNSFTDTRSGVYHDHDMGKHRGTDLLNLTDEVADRLYFNEYDHAGPHELLKRRQEFENAPVDVFEDVPNDDSDRWNDVQDAADRALVPQSVKSQLDEMYA